MLLDEPTSSLDPVQKRDMASLLQRLSKDRNMAVLMVSHDVQTCAEQVDYVLPMRCGRLLPSQRPAAFLAGMDAVYGDV